MSQPLSGQIKPFQPTLGNPEGRLLYLLADMVDRHTGRSPRTTWADIGRTFGWHGEWTREVARRLRRRGLIATSDMDGRSFRISLVVPTVVRNPTQTGVQNPTQTGVPNNGLPVVHNPGVDNPPYNPPSGQTAPDRPSSSAEAKGLGCVRRPNVSNGPGAHTPPASGEKSPKRDALAVPCFEALDGKMVPRLRQRYADKVIPMLEVRLQAIKRHLDRHPADGDQADLAWAAIQRRIKAINAWVSGIKAG